MGRKAKKTKKSKKSQQPETSAGSASEGGSTMTELGAGDPVPVKFPIGNVDKTLPANFVLPTLKGETVDALENLSLHDPPGRSFLYTTVPPQPMSVTSAADSPDNWTECLLKRNAEKLAIFTTPGFPAPVTKPPQKRHRIGPSAHGSGMFATQTLQLGDLIFAERPLLVVPITFSRTSQLLDATPAAQITQAHLAEVESHLQICADRMLPENRESFMALHDCHTEDGSGPIFGRVRTNGIGITIDPASSDVRSAVCVNISRVNHSCTPNANWVFDRASFSVELAAVRTIEADEEIFISYCSQSAPKAQRQESLRPYGFQCACSICTDPDSDNLLEGITKSVFLLKNIDTIDKSDLETIDARRRHCLEWIEKIEQAKLQSSVIYHTHLSCMAKLSMLVGRDDEGIAYEAMAGAWSMACREKRFLSLEWLQRLQRMMELK